jgi:Gpi18-like mannosyltransferase
MKRPGVPHASAFLFPHPPPDGTTIPLPGQVPTTNAPASDAAANSINITRVRSLLNYPEPSKKGPRTYDRSNPEIQMMMPVYSEANCLLILKRWQTYVWPMVILLALFARTRFLAYESDDYQMALGPWYGFIQENGGRAFAHYFFKPYTPLYLYMFYAANLLLPHAPRLLMVKAISVVFDFVGAYFVYKLVRLKYPAGVCPTLAFAAALLAPTTFLNSSVWAQCDALYTAGLLACVYFLAVYRNGTAWIAYSVAFALKLQSIFLAPFLLILLLKRTVPWRHVVFVPAVYIVTVIPMWLAGRPLRQVLTIYLKQTDYYTYPSLGAANVYQFLSWRVWQSESACQAACVYGVVVTGVVVLLFCLCVWASRAALTQERMVHLALLSVLIVPFFLPRMHERYFFPADLLSIVFAFYFPRFFLSPVAVQFASLFSYWEYLFGRLVFPRSVLAMVILLVIVILTVDLVLTLYRRESPRHRRGDGLEEPEFTTPAAP